ncbi:MAG TPA: aminoacyl-tRNA hydrolase [Candidatus Paceibacterota bacterium]|nr:aminoacyl-tRNA hydrolase [Candidatus Paceibacterota bacterium]
MQWIIAGLGNPDAGYTGTRHNTGRDFLMAIAKKKGAGEWKDDKKIKAQSIKGELFGKKTTLLLPETYMNNSGLSFKTLVGSKKQAEQLVVLQDELDLPLGRVKISFGSSAGGHRGIDSVQKALKTKDFVRIRIGISPATPSGKLKKPDAEKTVDFVLGKFKPAEEEKLKKARKLVAEVLKDLLIDGREAATMRLHSK